MVAQLSCAVVVVQRVTRALRAFDARYGAQVLVDGINIMVGHVLECEPWHDLQAATFDGIVG